MNKFTMTFREFNNFIALLEKHNIDLSSQKALNLFESYKKVIQ
ncbi:hypothetical protein PN398_08055 [Romboutsia sp. 1001216sp1]|nr:MULTISPECIES: hypothetical protein [unclassified Romboutsia]MDB8790672.1 hypothetical protein [Romboutsia sp. 1001216sp1]MDB8803235.1 hypothetical protein [Romboutsia sp. 1001216sp1]MDB8814601.1 hypothetical protein [Romboutsia sp. 1001216sp1]